MPAGRATGMNAPLVDVVIEVPRGGFVKRDVDGAIGFVSPLPCPFNYGAVPGWVGGEGDLLDAVVLGPRLPRGTRVRVPVHAAVSMLDAGLVDDKLICGAVPPGRRERALIMAFFHFYAACKRVLALGGRRGPCACLGWCSVAAAFARAKVDHRAAGGGPGPGPLV